MLMTRQVRETEVIGNCGGAARGQDLYSCALALAESFNDDNGVGGEGGEVLAIYDGKLLQCLW